MKLYILKYAEINKNNLTLSMSSPLNYDKNSSLTELGIFNSMKIGEYFKFNDNIDTIYHSPALRCFKTAELISQYYDNSNIDMYCDDRLYGFEYIQQRIKLKNELLSLINDIYDKHSRKNVIIVTHGHCIDMLHKIYVNKLSDTELQNNKDLYIVDNCSLSCIDFESLDNSSVNFWNKSIQTNYSLID